MHRSQVLFLALNSYEVKMCSSKAVIDVRGRDWLRRLWKSSAFMQGCQHWALGIRPCSKLFEYPCDLFQTYLYFLSDDTTVFEMPFVSLKCEMLLQDSNGPKSNLFLAVEELRQVNNWCSYIWPFLIGVGNKQLFNARRWKTKQRSHYCCRNHKIHKSNGWKRSRSFTHLS